MSRIILYGFGSWSTVNYVPTYGFDVEVVTPGGLTAKVKVMPYLAAKITSCGYLQTRLLVQPQLETEIKVVAP